MKFKCRSFCLFCLMFVLAFSVSVKQSEAVQYPRVGGKDGRFGTYVYKPNTIYKYTGYYLVQTFIEFGKEETIGTITMGDPTAWEIKNMGSKLFLKPIADYPETNMTIMTNKHIYYFELTAKETEELNDDGVLYSLHFVYPDDNDKTIVKFPVVREKTDLPDLSDLSKYNFDYEFAGNDNIAPVKVFDNGEFTYLEFRNKNAELPAIFLVDSQGYESLVNFRIAGDYIIVEQVADQFTLRNGPDVVCIYNNNVVR